MDMKKFTLEDFWSASKHGPREQLKKFWRIIHLLGNPWLLNVLVELGKPGLTFAELRFFLCEDHPKPEKVNNRLQELKETLSDRPALNFHLPPYRTTSQLSRDLGKLRKMGLLTFDGAFYSVEKIAYNNLVCEWEKDSDASDISEYAGEEVLRFGSHIRLYGLGKSLFSTKDVEKLKALAHDFLVLAAKAYRIEATAKVRAWKWVREQLHNCTLPKSVANRLLNVFWLHEAFPIVGSRFYLDDTPTLILSEMIRAKEAQLMHLDMEGKLSEAVRDKAINDLMMKYTTLPELLKQSPSNRSTIRTSKRSKPPKRLEEPPFSNLKEKEMFEILLEYISSSQQDDDNRTRTSRIASECDLSMETFDTLRSLSASVRRGLTMVATTPHLPFVESPYYAITEKDFMDQIPPRDPS